VARSNVLSTRPPISTGGPPPGGAGPIAPAVPKSSPAQMRPHSSSISSKRRPRVWKSTPDAV
jgi:hypothetical protein